MGYFQFCNAWFQVVKRKDENRLTLCKKNPSVPEALTDF